MKMFILLYVIGGLAFAVTGILLCLVAAYYLVWHEEDFPPMGELSDLDGLMDGKDQ